MLRAGRRIGRGAAVAGCLLALAGCGLARAPKGGSAVALTVTRDFGALPLQSTSAPAPARSGTAVATLARATTVSTGPRGSVRAIGGVTAGPGDRWFQYVNGVQSDAPLTGAEVDRGYRVWWDLHSSAAPGFPPAVVGDFPEPFAHGVAGRRLPVVLICADDAQAACDTVTRALQAAGIPVARQGLGTGSGSDSLAIVVGVFSELTGQIDAALIEKGPSASGVYARFGGPGDGTLQMLDARGRVTRSAGRGTGLVAATRDKVSEPTWLITGTDGAGVRAAAAALTPSRLRAHFALAVLSTGDVPLPARSRATG